MILAGTFFHCGRPQTIAGRQRSEASKLLKQRRAIEALLSCSSLKQASKRCKVPERTLYYWLNHDDEFKAEYRRARQTSLSQVVARAQRLGAIAVRTLAEAMRDKDAKLADRIRAATAVLDFSLKGSEFTDMVEEIEGLRSELEALQLGIRGNQKGDTADPQSGPATSEVSDASTGKQGGGSSGPND